MRYVANIEIDVPGYEDIAEFELEIDSDVEHLLGGGLVVTSWVITEINGVAANTIPEVEKAVRAQLDDFALEGAIVEDYWS